jgi:hypothetical protein
MVGPNTLDVEVDTYAPGPHSKSPSHQRILHALTPPLANTLPQGANLLGDGSELLLEVLDPGIIGGVLLPVLGALPDALIVASAGLTGGAGGAAAATALERAAAQESLAVGIGGWF